MTTQKEAIQRELLDRATGKGREPHWGEDLPTKEQLVKALNFYSATVEHEKLQTYAIAWAKKFSPHSIALFVAQPAWKFQTFGALMRLESRGLKISEHEKNSIAEFVNGLSMPITELKTTKLRKKKKMSIENVNYRNFCDALDLAIEAAEYKEPKIEVDKKHSTDLVIETIQRELESIKEDPEIYPAHMTKWFTFVLKLMNGGKLPEKAPKETKRRVETVSPSEDTGDEESATTRSARGPRTPAKKTAVAKGPKTPMVPKEEQPTGEAHPMHGKKYAFLFDTRYGRLTRMVSNSKNGFEIKGKTIHNIDATASKVALLKNYGDAMQPGKISTGELMDWMVKCVKKGNPISVGSRLAAEVLVLEVA